MKQILTIRRGDTRKIPVQLFDTDGTPLSLAQVEDVFFTLKRRKLDADVSALIIKNLGGGIEIVDANTSTLQVVIDPADTASITGYTRGLHWDIQIITVVGEVYTMADGLMTIEADVTQRIA
jgi:hypothetical protein